MQPPIPSDRNQAFEQDAGAWRDVMPYGWIQFKGTNLCMDIHCKCGALCHIDGDFVYEVKCPHCKTVYYVSGFVKLIPISKSDERMCKVAEPDEDFST